MPDKKNVHEDKVKAFRKHQLDIIDANINRLEKFIQDNPSVLPEKKGDLIIPKRLVNKGTRMTIRIVSYGKNNAAFLITKDCFAQDAIVEPQVLNLQPEGDTYCQEMELEFDVPGNTKLELWVDGERIVRQIAVLDVGYMMVIPWVGTNKPQIDEEIHRFDIAGDYWMCSQKVGEDPTITIKNWYDYIKKHHKYGDRTAWSVNGKDIVPGSETNNIFELDDETQKRGLEQLKRQMQLLGYDEMELVASYTPGSITLDILEELGVKGLTSLCAWQNWQDYDWMINHCGVANQPYYPASDDFRRAGTKRDIMCFTMGNSSCNRNYSIMVLDGCPSNIVPGERYFDHRVLHHNVQRFYDIFDGYIADSKNNEKPLVITIALEAFRGFMDWSAVNDLAVRYMVKKAQTEKIVFTSAADVADYHKEYDWDMQEAYFFQPDYYYGYHNGEMPGRVADRIEADTPEYLAVVKRGSGVPMYFYDYTVEWDNPYFEETERNEFGLVNPDTHRASECYPKQVYTEDISVESSIKGQVIKISIDSKTSKERMVTGVFDVPFDADFETKVDKKDVKLKKITDQWTGNTHLFVDLGYIKEGHTDIEIIIEGKKRVPISAECVNDKFAVMWYGNHGYLRCTDKDAAIKVRFAAPNNAYIQLINGEKVLPQNGMLEVIVNKEWFNESSILWGYDRMDFEKAISDAQIEDFGPTNCSRWSGQ